MLMIFLSLMNDLIEIILLQNEQLLIFMNH